jgi:hypothetical protein
VDTDNCNTWFQRTIWPRRSGRLYSYMFVVLMPCVYACCGSYVCAWNAYDASVNMTLTVYVYVYVKMTYAAI